jgi:hypothetical protein
MRRYETQMNCPATSGLALKLKQLPEKANEPSDGRFGRRVSDKVVIGPP